MIDELSKIIGLLTKPVIFFFRYFQHKPRITLTLRGSGCTQGPSHIPGALYFRWNRELVLHNDSKFLVRGIKLLRPFPKPWTIGREIPTRLEPDQKVTIPIEAQVEEDHQKLLDQFGTHMQHRLGDAVFPTIVADVMLEFELKNQQGRTVYQYSTFREDGIIETEIFSKRRAHGS